MKYIYRIEVKSSQIKTVLAEDGTNHFISPVTKKSKKIYLVGKNGLIHYIGITKQSIASRLRYGISPNHKTGYHGYKWLKENGEHCLVIWMFSNDTDVEAIEAEIVYFFRKQHGKWPKYQTEIHFHPTTKDQRALAKRVLTESQKIINKFT
ncbi:MAG: hypothetical protein WC873_03895 [Candidatus Gracilibacteria bacterium]